jgi:anti-sigma factor RsiW
MSQADRHSHVVELVPWYVNGTLDGRDREEVTAHLKECLACRQEFDQCQALVTAVRSAADAQWAPAPERLERLLASIELLEETNVRRVGWRARWRAGTEWLRDLFRSTPSPVRWALAVQAAALVLVVGLAVWPGALSSRAPYRTLADGDRRVGQALIHVVFAEGISEREMRTLLERVQGKIVDGPSSVGLYTVEIRARTPDQAMPMVAILRGDPKVRFAEPVPGR